jgi:hypothetical protein
MKKKIALGDITAPPELFFNIPEDGKNVEVLKISKDGFYYKGERVEDINKIYERFSEWMNLAEKAGLQLLADNI